MIFNRLWPLVVLASASAVVGFFLPQVPAVATGYALLVALLWRHQSRAVEAIEGRDGVRVLARPQLAVRAARSCCGCRGCARSSRTTAGAECSARSRAL